MLRRILMSLCLLAPVPGFAAQGVLYDCDITEAKRTGGWIGDKIAIVHFDDGTATVSDSFVLAVNSGPIQAKVKRNTDRKLVVTWTIEGYETSGNQYVPYFDFRATIKKDGAITVYAQPDGYHNRFSGSGMCRKRVS
ncbi:hypothetical protein [Roseobacter sp.]|uniref:hypothetical protein n=1 Tax=Roseobacter sp. TaxID=1907202 RepID=UPI0032999E53